jgi:hypothetical protein
MVVIEENNNKWVRLGYKSSTECRSVNEMERQALLCELSAPKAANLFTAQACRPKKFVTRHTIFPCILLNLQNSF